MGSTFVNKLLFFCLCAMVTTPPIVATPTADSNVSRVTYSSPALQGVGKQMSVNCSFHPKDTPDVAELSALTLSKTDAQEDGDFKDIAMLNTLTERNIIDRLGADVKTQLEAEGLSYIHYKWQSPGPDVAGKYRCSVVGRDKQGDSVELSYDTVLQEIPVDLEHLKSILRTTQEKIKEKQSELRTAESELNTTKEQLETTQQNLHQINVNLQVCQSPLFDTPTRYYKDRVYVASVNITVNMTVYKQSCASLEGKLVEIRSQDEYDVIKDYLTEHFANAHSNYFHVGVTDEGDEGNWRYMSDDSPLTFENWDPTDHHGNPGDHCGLLKPPAFLMADWNCTQTQAIRFLCEVPL